MSNREKEQWLAAIDKCLEQKEYGDNTVCELCKVAENCDDCICNKYRKYLEINYKYCYKHCGSVLENNYNGVEYYGIEDIRHVRKWLRRMRKWVSEQ